MPSAPSRSPYSKWTNLGEIEAAGSVARAVGSRPGCRRSVFLAVVACLALIVVLLVVHAFLALV